MPVSQMPIAVPSCSFAKMKVDSVKAEKNSLNLQLSGAPYYDPNVNNGYTAGVITVASEGFQEGGTDHSAYIDVVLPSAGVDSADLKVGNGTATVPLELTGMDASAITAEDVQFESGAEVTGVKADGENRVLVTVKTDNAEDLTGQITVGEQSYLTGVTHAGFYPTFVSIDKDGENFNITLDLDIRSGTVSDQISPDMVTLSEEFEGGKVTSLTKTDDTAAELTHAVLTNADMWGQDLTQLPGFEQQVADCLSVRRRKGALAAMKACL